MSKVILIAMCSTVVVLGADGSAPAPAKYLTQAELTGVLSQATPRGGMAAAPVAASDRYSINLVRRTTAAGAIAHPRGTEVHHIVEGAAIFVTGGTIVKPAGSAALATIEGGVERRVGKGDVILIPAGTPHWYKNIEGSITYLETRFDVEPK